MSAEHVWAFYVYNHLVLAVKCVEVRGRIVVKYMRMMIP